MARTSFSIRRFIPKMVIGLLVILNLAVVGIRFMGMGFKTPDHELWTGPMMPDKLLPLPDPASARVVGKAVVAVTEKPVTPPPPVAKLEPVVKSLPPLVPPPPAPKVEEGKFVVLIGSFALKMGMDSLMEQLNKEGLKPRIEVVEERVSLNNVQAGPFEQLEQAKEAEAKLKAGGLEAEVEETWEGFIISLSKSLLLSHAFDEMVRIKALGVTTLRMVKVDADLSVRKILLGPFETKEKAIKISSQVAALGIAVPVLKTWPLTDNLP